MAPEIPYADQHDYAGADAPVCGSMQEHLWGIVLAGGEGRRLQPFIRACFGCDRPKQFCAFLGGRSMLRHTLLCAAQMIPPEHLLIILTQPHLSYAQLELYDRPPATVCRSCTSPRGIQRRWWCSCPAIISSGGRAALWRRSGRPQPS